MKKIILAIVLSTLVLFTSCGESPKEDVGAQKDGEAVETVEDREAEVPKPSENPEQILISFEQPFTQEDFEVHERDEEFFSPTTEDYVLSMRYANPQEKDIAEYTIIYFSEEGNPIGALEKSVYHSEELANKSKTNYVNGGEIDCNIQGDTLVSGGILQWDNVIYRRRDFDPAEGQGQNKNEMINSVLYGNQELVQSLLESTGSYEEFLQMMMEQSLEKIQENNFRTIYFSKPEIRLSEEAYQEGIEQYQTMKEQ